MNCPYCNLKLIRNDDNRFYHTDDKHEFLYSIITENWYLFLKDKKLQIGKRNADYYIHLNDNENVTDLDPFDMKDSVKIIERFSKLLLFV